MKPKASKEDIELYFNKISNLISIIEKSNLSEMYFQDKKYSHKKDIRLTYCIVRCTNLFECIIEKNSSDISKKISLSKLVVNVLDYCHNFHQTNTAIKDIAKYYVEESKDFNNIKEFEPSAFVFHIIKHISDIKYSSWPAHQIGQILGQIEVISNYYKFD